MVAATDRACLIDPTLHIKTESFETSRAASSIKDETSIMGKTLVSIRPGDVEVSSRVSRISLCLDNPENMFSVKFPVVYDTISNVKRIAVGKRADEGNNITVREKTAFI